MRAYTRIKILSLLRACGGLIFTFAYFRKYSHVFETIIDEIEGGRKLFVMVMGRTMLFDIRIFIFL